VVDEVALLVADRSGTIVLWNERASALFGHEAAVAIGASLDLVVPEHLRVRHWAGFRRAWETGMDDVPRIAVLPVLCADGEVRRFPARLLPLRGPYGELAAIAGVYATPSDRDAALFAMG